MHLLGDNYRTVNFDLIYTNYVESDGCFYNIFPFSMVSYQQTNSKRWNNLVYNVKKNIFSPKLKEMKEHKLHMPFNTLKPEWFYVSWMHLYIDIIETGSLTKFGILANLFILSSL